MSTEIISGVDLDVNANIMFMKPKQNSSGGKNVGILDANSKKSLFLSSPLMLTWGVNEYSDEKSGRVSYDMSLQFPNGEYNTPELSRFLKNMQAFEEKVKEMAMENSKEWMNKTKMSKEVVDALWSPMLRYPKDKDTGDFDYSRAPTLRVKLPYWEGNFKNVEVYDVTHKLLYPTDDENTPTELISKGSNVATILQCGGVWFANGKFGVTWKLVQCLVKPKKTLSGKCHITLSESDRSKMVVDSDKEEDDDDDEVEETTNTVDVSEEPEPEPVRAPSPTKHVVADDAVVKPKKKVVKKKKPVVEESDEE
tara:strand:+ start:221 stop:1147 length:927 start_codon:yes stop_codon:yes gene_type:complete